MNGATGSHELIGGEVSLYTGKVRAYLRFKQIPFRETLATADVYRSTIIPRTGVRFIPVLITDDDVAIQDSTVIIDALEERYPEPSVYPSGPRQRLAALLLEIYGDEWLVLPAMLYRWQVPENRDFAIAEFGRMSAPDLPAAEQRAIGEKLAGPFAGALPHLGITADTEAAIERSYLAFLGDFDRHLAQQPFLLGTRPSIGDFGLIGPLYAHLFRDPSSGRLMKERAPRVHAWVERMIAPPAARGGDFAAGDLVPDTLSPILERMFAEQVPVLRATAARLAEWLAGNPDTPIRRSVGRVAFEVEGARGECSADPYRQWMWQRACDYYRALDPDDLAPVRAWLDGFPGAIDAIESPIPVRVARRENRIVRADAA